CVVFFTSTWITLHLILSLQLPCSTHIPSPNLNFLPTFQSTATSAKLDRFSIIRCSPRDNRGPLLKGRILSIEAIQALKPTKRIDPTISPTTSSLVSSNPTSSSPSRSSCAKTSAFQCLAKFTMCL
ncbi:THYLAKOID ASSEMBLY 8, chloroplastic, partial [Olea europaea subsp. europaea]